MLTKDSNIYRRVVASLLVVSSIIFACDAKAGKSDYNIKISLDSAHLLMGKQTGLHVEILQPRDGSGYLLLPTDTLTKDVEILKVSEPDTTFANNNGPMLLRQEITLQSFDSGLYPIGPLAYVTGDHDTIFSNPLSLKVNPVNVDSLETIHAFAPVINVKSKWWDFLPDSILDYYWIFLLSLLLICGIGFYIWLMMKKRGMVTTQPKVKQVSPFDAAISSLDILRDKHLCENGREKEYYTDLTDILRSYLDGRFGINAMEMTSSQILDTLEKDDEIRRHHDLIRRILEIADYVKFAKVRPLPSDNVKAWNDARQFVLDTRPVEKPSEPATDTDINDSKPLEKTRQ